MFDSARKAQRCAQASHRVRRYARRICCYGLKTRARYAASARYRAIRRVDQRSNRRRTRERYALLLLAMRASVPRDYHGEK